MFHRRLGPRAAAENRLADNLRRLLARRNLTLDDVVRRTGLDPQTIEALLNATAPPPSARTLHQLAAGLGVALRELLPRTTTAQRRGFDRRTNPIVDVVVRERPHLFDGWMPHDFDDLYSRFGTGGELNVDGALTVVAEINRRRRVLAQAIVVLETAESERLAEFVARLYGEVVLAGGCESSRAADRSGRASATTTEDAVVAIDDDPRAAVGLDDLRADDRLDRQTGRFKVPTHVARQVSSAG